MLGVKEQRTGNGYHRKKVSGGKQRMVVEGAAKRSGSPAGK